MQSLRAVLTITSVLFLSFASMLEAQAQNFVMCPSLDMVRQAAPLINKAQLSRTYPKKIFVAGADKSVFRDNNLYWYMGINNIEADSADEAIKNAQTLIPDITVMLSEIAAESGRWYECLYYLASSNIYQGVILNGSETPGAMQMPMTKTAIAARGDDVINCPSVDKIHKATSLMTSARIKGGLYIVATEGAAFEDNNVTWALETQDIRANSMEEAIVIAQNRAANVTQMLYQRAVCLIKDPLCYYYDATLQNPYISIFATGKIKK
jgi:hypothetical protein